MYLLDINVVSELRKSKPHGAVLSWLRGVDESLLHLSAVTVGEIQARIEPTRAQAPAKADEISSWPHRVAAAYNVLPMDTPSFDCGRS